MEKVSICRGCGRTINSDFVFCPWCGSVAESGEYLDDAFDAAFDKAGALQHVATESRIERMSDELGELEKALSSLISSGR